jgi:hypothetical protein
VAALAEVRTSLAVREAVAEEQQHGSRRGFTYERAVADLFSKIASRAGDGGADLLGGTTGSTGKKGDVVIELTSLGDPAPRLCVEAKDRTQKKLGITDWRRELAEARKNRSASVALGVTRPELMPTAGNRVIVLDDRTLLMGWSPEDGEEIDQLATAVYLLARLGAAASAAAPNTVAVGEVRRQVNDLLHSLTHLDTVVQQVGTAQRALGRITDASAAMRADVEHRVAAAQTLLTA